MCLHVLTLFCEQLFEIFVVYEAISTQIATFRNFAVRSATAHRPLPLFAYPRNFDLRHRIMLDVIQAITASVICERVYTKSLI